MIKYPCIIFYARIFFMYIIEDFFTQRIKECSYKNIVTKFIMAIVMTSFFFTKTSDYEFDTAEYFINISFGKYIAIAALIFTLLFFFLPERFNGHVIITSVTALFLLTNYQDRGIYLALLTSVVAGGFCYHYGYSIKLPKLTKKGLIIFCCILGGLLALFIGGLTILKYLGHKTPNFDFGIFSQMYHYMSKTLIPFTTCERDMLLSHFAVHFSPVLYLGLPLYWIFPDPSTVLATQAIVVALGIIPLYKLSKHFNLSNYKTLAVILIYVLHPTVIANNFYYFHENCYLTVLLLWTFYFAEKGKSVPMYIFAVLTMMVKEDAPVYIMFFGLYLLLSNKSKIKGGILCGISALYFAVVTKLMAVYGQGIMTYRYDNFIFEKDGTIYDVILNVIKNPTYTLQQLLSPEKLQFLILMLVPMALLPLAIKKPSRIILLFPLILMNLMTDYKYQYDIGFQYTYATVAFLFYLTVLNISELDVKHAKNLLLCGVCASMIFFSSVNYSRLDTIESYKKDKEKSELITESLATIPMDKSIRSTTWFIPALWNRDEVYEFGYNSDSDTFTTPYGGYAEFDTDYVVFDLRYGKNAYDRFKFEYSEEYEQVLFEDWAIAIFKAK